MQRLLDCIFEHTLDCVVLLDKDYNFIRVSKPYARVCGREEAEFSGRNHFDLYPSPLKDEFDEAIRTGTVYRRTARPFTFPDHPEWGVTYWDLGMVPIPNAAGAIELLLFTLKDVTEWKRTQEALRASEKRFRAIFDQTFQFIGLLTTEGRLLEANRTALEFAGIREQDVIGKHFWETPWWSHSEALRQQLREAIAAAAAGQFMRLEVTHPGADGVLHTVDFSLKPVRDDAGKVTLLIPEGRDITDRKLLEEQLQQARKMEAIGQLAGGIAHDFNNLLTIICGYSEVLSQKMDASPLREHVGAIRDAGERAALLTGQLLTFSRRQVLEPKILNLNDVVGRSEKLLGRLIGENILLTTTLDPALFRAKADPGQVEQVVFNLAINARDAMPEGGQLTIATSNARLDPNYCRHHPDCKPGDYVQLTVTDTGCGMTDAVKSHIFEPFYTTKEQGKGTGLGLSTVYGIIKQSDGHIQVDSAVGLGTTFRIFLPAFPDVAVPAAENEPRLSLRGHETVVVVEDDAMVREIALLTLTMEGYVVLAASSGREALELVARHPGPIHLVVTDLVMPDMSGRELAQHLHKCLPTLRILYMSGYTEDVMVRHGVAAGQDAFLAKPFTPLVLARKVRQALNEVGRAVGGDAPRDAR